MSFLRSFIFLYGFIDSKNISKSRFPSLIDWVFILNSAPSYNPFSDLLNPSSDKPLVEFFSKDFEATLEDMIQKKELVLN